MQHWYTRHGPALQGRVATRPCNAAWPNVVWCDFVNATGWYMSGRGLWPQYDYIVLAGKGAPLLIRPAQPQRL